MSTPEPPRPPAGDSSALTVLGPGRDGADPPTAGTAADAGAGGAVRLARRCRHCATPDGRHDHPAGTGTASDRGYHETLADLLDLEGRAVGALLDEIVASVVVHAPAGTSTVVDVGAGTGTGAVRLAEAFPSARVVALDRSAVMLDRLAARARRAGLGGRVTALAADLDDGWPDGLEPDLVWAASSLGDLAEPDDLLADVQAALRPGGVVVVTEAVGPPRFLPSDGLEDRVAAALLAAGWSSSPDWGRSLDVAGLTVVERCAVTLPVPAVTLPDVSSGSPVDRRRSGLVGRYGRAWFTRVRNRVGDALDRPDRMALDRLLAAHGPDSLLHRTDLVLRTGRVVWVARRSA